MKEVILMQQRNKSAYPGISKFLDMKMNISSMAKRSNELFTIGSEGFVKSVKGTGPKKEMDS